MSNRNRNLAEQSSKESRRSGAYRRELASQRLRSACRIEGLEPRLLMSRSHSVGAVPVGVPVGLNAAATNSGIQVNWSERDASVLGYVVLRSQGSKFAPIAKITSPETTTFFDAAVAPNTTYRYQVQAYSAVKSSSSSKAASVTTPLAAPSALTATATSTTTALLSWKNNDRTAAGYYLYRSVDGGPAMRLKQLTSGGVTNYLDKTISLGHTYTYQVQAYKSSKTSVLSGAATIAVSLVAPSDLTATQTGAGVQLGWTNHDAAAAGYYILRMTDGGSFALLATLTPGSTSAWTDASAASGHVYTYAVQAFAGGSTSAASNTAGVTMPLAGPSSLAATATSGAVLLSWVNSDSNAAGYYVFRSTDGVNFSLLATVSGGSVAGYADTSTASAQAYAYYVQAFNSMMTSAASNPVTVSTPVAAPSGLAATLSGSSVNLAWTNNDSATTGYLVLRSTDGANFAPLVSIGQASTKNYTDQAVVAGQKYYYKVQALIGSKASSASNTVNITVAAPAAPGSVTISTRYGKELVITGTSANDSISISQSGSMLLITADGQSYSNALPAAGVFIYTRGGSDAVSIDSTVTVRTTVQSIDGAFTFVSSAATNVSVWADSTDSFSGAGVLHRVSNFAGGVSKALGASLANPSDAGSTKKISQSLWGTGPVAADVNQGGVGDCYFLASLAGFAGEKPSVLLESAVDMGDGTYAVQFYSGNTPVYVRVSNDFSTGYFGGFAYAHPGASGAAWAMVLEKAFCYFRTGDNTYDSINAGWMSEVYSDLGVSSTYVSTTVSETSFYNTLATALSTGKTVTFGTSSNAPNLVSGHAYTLISVSIDGNGVTHYVVRNPWGVSGDTLENSQGYATLTFAQMKSNFTAGVRALS